MIQTNSEGRPCGWGMVRVSDEPGSYARAVEAARREAERQWQTHACYPGEARGAVRVHDLEEELGACDLCGDECALLRVPAGGVREVGGHAGLPDGGKACAACALPDED